MSLKVVIVSIYLLTQAQAPPRGGCTPGVRYIIGLGIRSMND